MTDNIDNSDNLADDMAAYLQTFLDETEEQLDDLVETLLALERDSTTKDDLNEAFRLIHSIKGAAGMMGFDNITVLTHHLESRFERFRSGTERLDEATMNLVLRCIDFLRQSNHQLRNGGRLGSSAELLDELKKLEEQADTPETIEPSPTDGDAPARVPNAINLTSALPLDQPEASDAHIRMVVRFRAGLPLADLKAQLIVARLSALGEVRSTQPNVDQLSEVEQLEQFEVRIETHEGFDRLRAATDVDGVESIKFFGASSERVAEVSVDELIESESSETSDGRSGPLHPKELTGVKARHTDDSKQPRDETAGLEQPVMVDQGENRPTAPANLLQQHTETPGSTAVANSTTKVAETMRVDIERLDNLMNLAGELVVNRARFVQLAGQLSPALRTSTSLNRVRDFKESLRRTIQSLEQPDKDVSDRSSQIKQLKAGLELIGEQSDIWEHGRHCFGQISEAIDQLSSVSHGLQRGVLETRMVPVGPLFNRFKRVVRDLSKERGKRINLLIRGEKTELDKRMIDELGDPLVHLVRNSIDHGLESPDVRADRGKPEVGTIFLEASHSGNNVFIHVRDDGGGIDVKKIKAMLLKKGVLSELAVDELSDARALEYIWHPGFSTAKNVTNVSGRGVGMDVVKTRISRLNGTIEVDSTWQHGTTFTLRLPLTLAIIDCLLVRLRGVMFSMPIDDVREIVSVNQSDIVTVQGKQTFDVRGEFLPLVSINDVFHWHNVDYGYNAAKEPSQSDSTNGTTHAVILHIAGKTMGLPVDELLGSEDIVIKSLSDNFVDIRGLSGASVLGDGSVCLMLDVGKLIDMATRPTRIFENEGSAT